ncbi:thiol reductant ABC exporter subunit CydD [Streptomyces sp. AC536]|uniref:thiol reductant ABC exporter subunit CydD n=1 Tax=Streptomyces buecherae TaxID=2763006 RepID=UPI00164DEEB1|nr:thiol reductant ABC exporter subunit CydD [Streptomyces buecherae]MBC3982439.1 thiol reductant ABC exporter subunit CydD [Streptomyces buecherae]QNJ41253.1 thiol reductant ABC exporter subunit CydD [Streptomyces buecherae]
MKPIDPRLLRYARATHFFLLASVALGLIGAGLVIAQAMLIAGIVVGTFQRGESVDGLAEPLMLLVGVAVGRAAVASLTELAAHRASAEVKSELRMRLLTRATELGPGWLSTQRTGELTTLATRGVDALDDYFARYLPQLGLAVVVPLAVLARIVTEDWVSALIIVITLPLIPVFMMLIGWATQHRMDRQWRLLSRLSGHFLDVVAGLPTLKVFGRAKAQAESIRAITSDYRRATLKTLRIAFLSSFALELLATLSVALVAVGIGMRLVHGDMDLYAGLVVLILAPEAYLPLRQVGAEYHAAAEGLAAADEVFAVLETGEAADARVSGDAAANPGVPGEAAGGSSAGGAGRSDRVPDARSAALVVDGLVVRHPGRTEPSLDATSFAVAPGETVAVVGPSGAGKSTLLQVVLGFVGPGSGVERGGVRVGDTRLADLTDAGWRAWRDQVAWVPQRPYLFAGTIAENVRLARPDADDEAVRGALRDASALDFVTALPDGPRTVIGEDGVGLSAGQRQRLALARAFLADRPVLLLDEPTANLDGETEALVVDAVRRLAVGRTVLLIVHRPALLAIADRVVHVGPTVDATPAGERDTLPTVAATGATARAARAVVDGRPERVARSGARQQDGSGADRAVAEPVAEPMGPVAGDAPAEPATGGRLPQPAPEEGPGRRKRGALALVRAVGRERRGRFALALLLGSLALGSAVGLMAVSGWLISRASQQPPVLYLMVAVTATRAFGIGRAVFRYAERLVSHDAALRVLADLRVAVYRRLERLAPAGLRESRRGDLLSRLVADVDAMQDYFLRWLLPVGSALVVGTASVGFMAWLLPEAGALLAVGLLAAGVGVPLLTSAWARRTERQLAPARGALSVGVVDLLTGTAELTVAGALPTRTASVRRADGLLTTIARRAAGAGALGAGFAALSCGVTVSATAWVGVQAVRDGRLDGLWLAVVVLTPLAAFETVAGLPSAVRYRQRVRRAAERVHEVLDAPSPVREPDPAATPPEQPHPLVVRGLTARYPGQRRPAVAELDLELVAGRRVAVVGPSGSGKTTLAQVLLRFLDPEAGTYTLAGADATGLAGDAVRRLVGLCAQDAHLFDSSLRENLRLARPGASTDELRAALAGARLLDWADGLPDGLDSLVGEHGARLSGGQRQRLALARALLADFPVLVLDEPAEHLDLPTADALTRDLLAATEGRTTVLITHRLAGLDAVDEVLVLDAGRVVQRGSYDELVAVPGPFRRMLERERATEAGHVTDAGAEHSGANERPPAMRCDGAYGGHEPVDEGAREVAPAPGRS